MDRTTPSIRTKIVAATAIVVCIIAVIVAAKMVKKPATATTTVPTNTATQTQDQTSASDTTSGPYKDGSYSAIGTYNSPGGREKITINVTLAGNVVTATSAKSGATDIQAESYQDAFISNYQKYVVGKNINEVSLGQVAGSSLTAQGFNDAVQQIKQQARS